MTTTEVYNQVQKSGRNLRIILWIMAIHSFLVGIGLILQFDVVMKIMGFGMCREKFFPAQGGVFHIVMALGYVLPAKNLEKYQCLALFSILVKALATVFLLTYYIFFEQIWTVLASGIIDGIMCLAVFYFYKQYINTFQKQDMDNREITVES
jgi:hypothetical protein